MLFDDPGTAPDPGASQRARELAASVDGLRRRLTTRLDEVRRLHHPGVWSSSAATAGRARIERIARREVWLAAEELQRLAAVLRRHAAQLDAAGR